MRALLWALSTVLFLSLAGIANAQPPAPAPPAPTAADVQSAAQTGHIAWMLTSSALVLLMTGPGLALFYGGLVRKKNVLGVMMQCVFLMGMNSITWALFEYSLVFSANGPVMMKHGDKEFTCIGGLDMALLRNVEPELKGTEIVFPQNGKIPTELHMIYQMMFFIITPALIAGAFAERMRFSAMVMFTFLWGLIVYCPLAHWVWGPKAIFGPDSPYYSLDFAGGLVVHASSGVSALLCALFLGKRLGYGKEPMPPHNLTYTVIGACLLWFGWFGFNAGSALASDTAAVNAFVVTHLCAAAALLAWAGAEWIVGGKPTILGASSGLVAGLVVITPASGFVLPMSAILMGLAAGLVCFIACAKLKPALGYDDSLDAFGVHGVGGLLGALLTGVFATKAVFATVPDNVVMHQLISMGAAVALAIVGTLVCLAVVRVTVGLRVTADDERKGLDLSQHNEEGYIFV